MQNKFPMDDITLAGLRAALDNSFDAVDENGDPTMSEGRFGVSKYLEFLSQAKVIENNDSFNELSSSYSLEDACKAILDELFEHRAKAVASEASA